jgi:hypothetical protein
MLTPAGIWYLRIDLRAKNVMIRKNSQINNFLEIILRFSKYGTIMASFGSHGINNSR